MPLMGALYVGTSGLQTSQNALNTTAHNFSNIETTGYVRQQVQQSSKSYLTLSTNAKSVNNPQTGLGVSYSRVKHIRDSFLDRRFRKESGRSMFYEVSMQTMTAVESQLGELNGKAFQTSLEDLWTAIQELDKDPASSVTQGLLVQRAEEFIQRAGAVYQGFCDYQDNLNLQVKREVDKINKYGQQILALNEAIRGIEAGDIESANDLRDTRDQLIDELAELADINYGEYVNGDVWIQIEGMDFVKGPICFEIGLDADPESGFYTPFWIQNATYTTNDSGVRIYDIRGAEVFNLDREISTDLNTDIGGLKAILLARGDHRADYTDMVKDYDSVSQSILMNMQTEFDQLVHNVTAKVNDILAKAAGVQSGDIDAVDDKGNVIRQNVKFCLADSNGYMRKDDGSPIQMFTTKNSDGYTKVKLTLNADLYGDADGKKVPLAKAGDEVEVWIYTEEDFSEPATLYSALNMQVDTELQQKPSMLGFRLEDGSEDKATAAALKEAFEEMAYTLNPNVKKPTSFITYYTDLVSQVANSGYAFRSIYQNQVDAVEAIEGARQQVSGVSSDEELSNMIKFQNAYNASSRYINVIDEMLEHILNTLGA